MRTPLRGYLAALLALAGAGAWGFVVGPTSKIRKSIIASSRPLANDNSNINAAGEEYDRVTRLREEAESPFRKLRFFLYLGLGAGASLSLAVSLARIGAASSGINSDLMQESLLNAGVDTLGIAAIWFFYQRDLQAQELRLKRVSKGAALAKLLVRGSKAALITGNSSEYDGIAREGDLFTTSLASLRRGRGIEKRVVIAVAGPEKISSVMQEAGQLEDELQSSDLLIVPVVWPKGEAPSELDIKQDLPNCVALPVGFNWKSLMAEEAEEAKSQDVDVTTEGFCVILKKNGRVGQRTRGILLRNMVEDVLERASMGLDIKNI